MTVSTGGISHSYYPGGDMLPEDIPFAFIDASDLVVTDSTGATLVLGTDYSIMGDGRAVQAVILALRAFAGDVLLTVTRDTDIVQEAVLDPFKPLPADVIERELDRRAMIEQELDADRQSLASRALLAPAGQPGGPIPTVAQRAGKFMVWSASGLALIASLGTGGGDVALRGDLAAATGAQLIGVEGGGDLGERLKAFYVSPMEFGAVGDGIADDTVPVKMALESGRPVHGGKRWYALSEEIRPSTLVGFEKCKFRWTGTGPMAVQQALINVVDLSDWYCDDNDYDLGTVENTGSYDDSSRCGLRVSTSAPNVIFNEYVSIHRQRVKGAGNGTGIYVRSCRYSWVQNNLVRDRILAEGAPNDAQNGMDISQSTNMSISGNIVRNLYTRVGGVPTKLYSRGMLFFELRDSSIVDNHVTNCDQNFDFSGAVDGVVNTVGNRGLTITANTSNGCRTWGFKFANCIRDSVVSACVARDFGLGGFVFSGFSSAPPMGFADRSTSNITVTVCYARDPNAEMGGNAKGFWIGQQPASPGYARGIKLLGCIARSNFGNMQYGFLNEIPYDGTSGLLNEIDASCRSTGHSVAAAFGFAPWITELNGTSVQMIPNATLTPVAWDNERVDGSASHTASDESYIVKADGTYRVTYSLEYASNPNGFRRAIVTINGNPLNFSNCPENAVDGTVTTLEKSVLVRGLVLNDTIRVATEQNSGAVGGLALDRTNSLFTVELVRIA